ncbi:MAG: L,D-transpeptidase/peptidoglycan binding protein [Coriobacteriales bacterium]|nr:L,D-transpeptidase/peptidoglycan binding protein [Coriobacteriales bacterium]
MGIVCVILITAYGAATYYFSLHFDFNTSINNVDCSLKTVEEVEQTIHERVSSYQMTIKGRESLNRILKAADVELVYVPDGQVQALLDEQNPFLWITSLFRRPENRTTTPSVTFDEKKFDTAIRRLDLFNALRMQPPEDAYAEFKDSRYVVHPEKSGSTLDEPRTKETIKKGLRVMIFTIDLDEAGCYVPPKVFGNNPDLNEQVRVYNAYVPFEITYQFGDEVEILDASIALDWIDIAEDGSGTLNEGALIAWMRDFGLRHDTVGKERNFTSKTGEEATVAGGTYGWEVDETAEIEAVKAAIINHSGEEREPYYVQRAAEHASPGDPDWGTTYIELDLTNQHMYYIVDGNIELEADVVTGAPWGGRATPPGVYSILQMLSPTVLVGQIQAGGEPEYETPVSFWMRMTWEGHGFHDATWQPWFGGSRYTYAGSHGCINMSYYDARDLYNVLEMGTPVVSHY